MRPHWFVVLAACGGGESPGIATRNPALEIRDGTAPRSKFSPLGSSQVLIFVELASEICAPLDESFGGTFRGAPMTVASPGTTGQSGDLGFCGNPTLSIDPNDVTAPDGNTIEAFDASGSVSVTFPAGELDARTMTAASFDLHGSQPFTVTWSHPEDLIAQGANPQLTYRQTFDNGCMEGCAGAQFSTSGSQVDASHVQFIPFSAGGASSGEVVVTMGFEESGEVSDCNAKGCLFTLRHPAVHSATSAP